MLVDQPVAALDPATFPEISVVQDVSDWNHEIAGPAARQLVLDLAENLELENQALLLHDPGILPTVDHGDRLVEMQARLADATASGTVVVTHYRFDSFTVSLLRPFGRQSGLSLGLAGRGSLVRETYDGAGVLQSQQSSEFSLTFAVRRATGARWLIVAVLPTGG